MTEAVVDGVLIPAQGELVSRKYSKENYRRILRRNVEEYGLVLGIRKTIDIPQNSFERNVGSEETQKILEQHPLLLILTHNYGSEVLAAIGGLPKSNSLETFREVKLLAEAASERSWLSKYVLPLYNTRKEPPAGLIRKISRKISPPEIISTKEAVSANAVALRTAGEIIGRGGAVVICPEGTREKYGRWQIGVCAIMKVAKRLLEKENKNGYIVFCDVKGLGIKSHLEGKVARWFTDFSPFRSVTVSYSKPTSLSEIDTTLPPEEMTNQIEGKYREWLHDFAAK